MRQGLSRRALLIGGAGALAIGIPVVLRRGRLQLVELINSPDLGALAFGTLPTQPALWLEARPDDTLVLRSPKVEMGQGIHTTLARLIAAELGVRFDQVRVVQADTAAGFAPNNLDTGGSVSSKSLFIPARSAAALVREALEAEAARQLGVPVVELVDGRLHAPGVGGARTVGEVVSQHRGDWVWPEQAVLRPIAQVRAALAAGSDGVEDTLKLRGRATYGYDARLPGMLYGAVARPPRYLAQLTRAGAGAALSVPGVVKVVLEDGFAGVVATTRAAASDGVQKLELTWSGGATLGTADVEALVVADPSATLVHDGPPLDANEGESVLEVEFRTALAAHCPLEPQAALVDCSGPKVRAWISTQLPSMALAALSEALGRSPADIVVTPTYVGGGFGRKSGHDVAVEAARLSRAAGVPVHVGWTRQEELQRDFFRPPTHHRLKAVVDARGRVRGVEHHIASGDVALSFGGNPIPGGQWGAQLIGFDPATVIGIPGPYAFPSIRVTMKRIKLPIPTGSWRGLGAVMNTFALESLVNDLAVHTGRDPLELRLELLPDAGEGAKLKALLQAVRASSRWDSRAGRALGVACASYHGTTVANVVQATLNEGQLRAERVWVAVDAGLVLDEVGARAQVEGGVTWGVSAALKEEITLHDGMAVEARLAAYRFAGLRDVPEVSVEFLSTGDEPFGLGEAPLLGVTPALRDAARHLGAVALDRMPLRPGR